jgi:tRNA A37 methylthiotransferase MiaB
MTVIVWQTFGRFSWLCANDNPNEADILLMNTCSIREKAQEKVFSELGRWRKLKEQNPDLVIGVGGCCSQEGDNIQKRAPYVDMVLVHKPCTVCHKCLINIKLKLKNQKRKNQTG